MQPDGAVDVSQTEVLRTPAGAVVHVREIDAAWADDVTFLGATYDGRERSDDGKGGETIAVSSGRSLVAALARHPSLRVEWRAAAPAEGLHTFGLRYRLVHAIKVIDQRGYVNLDVLPARPPAAVDEARISFLLPESMALYDPSGIAQAGWVVTREDHGIAASAATLDSSAGATVSAQFAIDRARVGEPSWQRHEDFAAMLAPSFISGGLFILVIVGGVLWILRFQHPRHRLAVPEVGARPGDVAADRPALAGHLRTTAWVCVVFSVAGAGLCWLFVDRLGLALMAMPASILVAGVVFAAAARAYR